MQNGRAACSRLEFVQSRPVELGAVEGIEELHPYASINFKKSDETRGISQAEKVRPSICLRMAIKRVSENSVFLGIGMFELYIS